MKIDYNLDGYAYLTDDTANIAGDIQFLLTAQNQKYFDKLEVQPSFIKPKDLIEKWGLDSIKTVGVTGTNGKTTVTAAIYSFLLDLDEGVALQGTRGFFANEERVEEKIMTTPSILETLYHMKIAKDKNCSYFIMEVSSHAIDQERIEDINFALKIHTNVTSDHLDYHGTVEEYRVVKSRFFADESPKLLNKDEIKNIKYNPVNAQSYGVDEPATFKVQAFALRHGITAGIKHLRKEATFHSPMVGLFNLFNLMAAIGAVTILTGRDIEEICEVVEKFAGVAGRMEVISTNPLVIVDFAHTDDGMLQVLDSMKDRDISVVFGAGGNRDGGKRARMGAVAAKFANKVYVTNDNPRDEKPEDIINEILSGIKDQSKTRAMVDRAFAIQEALRELDEDEVLMILGKGDEDYMEIAGEKIHFDDREVVRALLQEGES
ncbi:UDP-N-acetylmuramoyl-L-alanyl-D-glutamate--2,6-diaminopimelate ligase [Sulfurovum sp. bin170]|uniref:UDP-N-acetylmuramoyl-L-alanyl-D-glutamate--2, 6-diaminopimelate ligase n=1 Tax=Sulfurovum sp. bin170 TaxID=2695268 RepID=UPI0013DEEFFC|nr:UDP-N-acetylmuramoyl-L-alanyl-D-glutamate--2,6-diaminopimelate ligase [Sulfurovum sp. bin170]NEW60415.1 UDP-N-acetylmuramoyl-L-alanyl-D-glutamate--2,6-diaminopimelate ligase [Sulfurovum sp. bin170]